jgi:hypothetical protein
VFAVKKIPVDPNCESLQLAAHFSHLNLGHPSLSNTSFSLLLPSAFLAAQHDHFCIVPARISPVPELEALNSTSPSSALYLDLSSTFPQYSLNLPAISWWESGILLDELRCHFTDQRDMC